ncbi:AAA family ATPase [Aquimarina intermedia]|uniref:NadR type nicotinamide-nucleotide adenylyltransferase n=1 Tax=Aquimarina intermedia TaxID=350814 RepID=A0A5S5CGI4_9FLAO|nr:ATP-binding protein [Aquimarina intermedia]TYP77123.1 NadR type nicotinamide-nucleotide adenylyltransferase [Aquimarina intermedia]
MEEKLKQHPSHCLKIVVFGPESTGKTTLCKQLASHYDMLWIEEYARPYLQEKWDKEKKICTYEDLLPIAIGQMNLENGAVRQNPEILICDTDLLETKVYSEVYFDGKVPQLLDKFSRLNSYDLYLLTYIDTPWIPDDLRDKPDEREVMFQHFKNALDRENRPYVILKGNESTRLAKAITTIDTLKELKK